MVLASIGRVCLSELPDFRFGRDSKVSGVHTNSRYRSHSSKLLLFFLNGYLHTLLYILTCWGHFTDICVSSNDLSKSKHCLSYPTNERFFCFVKSELFQDAIIMLIIVSKGHGTYEDRMEMLRNIVDLVEASLFSDNPEWRLFIFCLIAIL